MHQNVFLITPPFTQLNTPYPATAYLKGFLNTKNITSFQCDLGIEVILHIFSKQGLTQLFSQIEKQTSFAFADEQTEKNIERIISLKKYYINTIDEVINFLQDNNATIANLIATRNFLPEANRFKQLENLQWAFGTMGITDKAKHLSTLYLEDLSDLIKECVDEHFGFSRYAEKLARSANSFDELYNTLQQPYSYIDNIMIDILEKRIQQTQPKLIALSIPFPGNLFSGLRCGQYIKQKYPNIKIALGGGFANTELRSLKDTRVFEFIDFVCLDDGEITLEKIIEYIDEKISATDLKRTFLMQNNQLVYIDNKSCKDYSQLNVGTPDYSNLLLNKYIQAIEIVNPMHSLWSNGRWNKLTMAHGCYWGKCTFCDVSLNYIQQYEPIAASVICDRVEQIIQQTGSTGFHFVDEAAPPSLMKSLAIEIIKRKINITWWTNIRFEKSFTKDICLLLKESGCIGVSGGLEVASDRLLKLINKGITVEQVAKVNKHFTEAGIMVHAYLMYGFPTQTAQETIDSLEMVKQMFKAGILQSAFWHLFTMTAHSPIGLQPEKFNVKKAKEVAITFADNDVEHIDPTGANHTDFSYGLKKSLFNFMQGFGLDEPVHKWFEHKVPKTTIAPNYIESLLSNANFSSTKLNATIIFIGQLPKTETITKNKKGNQWQVMQFIFQTKKETIQMQLDVEQGKWFNQLLPQLSVYNNEKTLNLQQIKTSYEAADLENFELFWDNKPINTLHKVGLLSI